jgi:hypothetical protein
MAPLIECDAMVPMAQHQAYEIPGVRVESATMQKQDRALSLRAPVKIVKPNLVDDRMVRLRQHEFGQFEPRYFCGKLEMFNLFGRFKHDKTPGLFRFSDNSRQTDDL